MPASGSVPRPRPDTDRTHPPWRCRLIYSYLKGFFTRILRDRWVNNTGVPQCRHAARVVELQGVRRRCTNSRFTMTASRLAVSMPKAAAAAYVAEHGQGYRLERVVGREGRTEPAADPGAVRPGFAGSGHVPDLHRRADEAGTPAHGSGGAVPIVFTVVAYLMKKEWWKDIH